MWKFFLTWFSLRNKCSSKKRCSKAGFFYAPPRMRKRIRLRQTLCTAHMYGQKKFMRTFYIVKKRIPIQFIGTPKKVIKLWIKRPKIIYLHIRWFHNFLPLLHLVKNWYNLTRSFHSFYINIDYTACLEYNSSF